MRLINVTTKTLEIFNDDTQPIPPYAILSHTWGSDHEEISFHDLQEGKRKTGRGQYKFDKCCSQAAYDGLSYTWIDTCCIDKASSTELSEAINSMFKWYKTATVCYAYLYDVKVGEDLNKPGSRFSESCWFQRGWTLQELIAPRIVQFYDSDWNELGSKRGLATVLHSITRIPRIFLLGTDRLSNASVAQRMSWAAGRVTKRKEDLAYCLLGIFGITMPMIYGEGERAFRRLQEEITKHIDDDSILAWNFNNNISTNRLEGALPGGALAPSPSSFAASNHIVSAVTDPIRLGHYTCLAVAY
ncbi:heterokaryon incompatibility protein-domain-containing protein [Nemania abortiva]|nr:heterokaryon incompatibility protein-domain-containing protein [Nemania abortiva]